MKIIRDNSGEIVGVKLSERNLLALLAKLDQPESLRTLTKGWFFVTAESDADHYPPDYVPGPMTPETEAAIQAIKQAIKEPTT